MQRLQYFYEFYVKIVLNFVKQLMATGIPMTMTILKTVQK